MPDFSYVTGTGAHDRITLSRTGDTINVADEAFADTSVTDLIRQESYTVDLGVDTQASSLFDGSILIDLGSWKRPASS